MVGCRLDKLIECRLSRSGRVFTDHLLGAYFAKKETRGQKKEVTCSGSTDLVLEPALLNLMNILLSAPLLLQFNEKLSL